LDAFLYGEQIAQILIERAKAKPFAVFTERPQVLAVQEFVELPICYIHRDIPEKEREISFFDKKNDDDLCESQVMAVVTSVPGLSAFRWAEQSVGRYQLAVPELTSRSMQETVDALKNVSDTIDLLEPFERIRLAIEEAQKAA
jgi:hypothetical protein